MGGEGHDEAGETLPPCSPDDLAVTLWWERSGDGLSGQVVARNVGMRACRLGGKPTLAPLGAEGDPLPAVQVMSFEMRVPRFVVLEPGRQARAAVSWAGWCGAPATGRVEVGWEGGSVVVDADGPTQPECPEDGATNLSSSWFERDG